MSCEVDAKYKNKLKTCVNKGVKCYVDDLPDRGSTKKRRKSRTRRLYKYSSRIHYVVTHLGEKRLTSRRKKLTWANENLDRDWNNAIFSDEASF